MMADTMMVVAGTVVAGTTDSESRRVIRRLGEVREYAKPHQRHEDADGNTQHNLVDSHTHCRARGTKKFTPANDFISPP
jgi:hypothetical protein